MYLSAVRKWLHRRATVIATAFGRGVRPAYESSAAALYTDRVSF